MPPPTTTGTRNSRTSSASPALMACPARPAPPTLMSCSAADGYKAWKPRATLRWKTTSNASITPRQPGSTATATSARRCLPQAAYQPWHHASRTPSHADTHPPANLRLPAPPVMSSSLPPEPATPAAISSPITKRDRRAAFLGRAVPADYLRLSTLGRLLHVKHRSPLSVGSSLTSNEPLSTYPTRECAPQPANAGYTA